MTPNNLPNSSSPKNPPSSVPSRNTIRVVAYGGVLSALVLIATKIINVPLPNGVGYFNLGDATIFISAIIMGPFAAAPAAIGSALSDLTSPYAAYAPGTFVIKGLMGFAAGILLRNKEKVTAKVAIPVLLLIELIMVVGYFFFEKLLSGTFAAAIATLIGNGLQAVAAIVLGLLLLPIANKIKSMITPTFNR